MERIPITRTSRIRLKVRNNFGATVTLGVRGYSGRSDFTQQTFGEIRFTPAHTDGTLDVMTIGQYVTPFSDPSFVKGYLYNVALYIVSPVSGVLDKQVFVTCELLSTASDGILARVLFSGYVSSNVPIGYPQTGIHSTTEGYGITQKFVPTINASKGLQFNVPNNTIVKLNSISGVFSSQNSVSGGVRTIYFQMLKGGFANNDVLTVADANPVGDGKIILYTFAAVGTVVPSANTVVLTEILRTFPIPQNIVLYHGDIVVINVDNFDPIQDTWFFPNAYCEVFLTP